MAVGPSAKRATTASVMATSGILFILTSMACNCFLPEEFRGGPGHSYTVLCPSDFCAHFLKNLSKFNIPLHWWKS